MSQTAITLVFEQWKAQQAATGEPVLLDEFVFALVPGLDPDLPVDRSETLPPAAQIVHREPVTRKGVVNENAVVHSAVLGADVGDFSFNWIGLTNRASGTLAMIVHAPEQQKLKTKEGQQGNVLTRSFLMEYSGAQAETAINTPAETWQIDFTARMAGVDERQRQENIDIYGAAAFFGDGWLVGKTGNQFFVTKGAGYVAGLRVKLDANQNITVTTKPVKVWLDVCWAGGLTSVWAVQSKVMVASTLKNYDQNGVKHYVFALASIDADGNIKDLRPQGSLDDQQASDALKKHEESRNHPDATLKEKGFVQLSSATDSDSEDKAATPKAVKAANDNASSRLKASENLADLDDISKAKVTLGLDKVGNWPAVQANGGSHSDGNHKFYVDWDGKIHFTVDTAYAGEVFTTLNPPTPAQSDSYPKTGGRVEGEVWSEVVNNFRLVTANRGVFWRFDGNACYLMFTKDGDPHGGYNALRPLIADFATGKLSTGHDFTAGGTLYAGAGKCWMATDGNVYGSAWGGYLSNWVAGQIAARIGSNNTWVSQTFVSGVQLGAMGWAASIADGPGNGYTGGGGTMQTVPAGCTVIGGTNNGTSNLAGLGFFYRPIQQAVNGQWVTIGQV